MKQVYTVFLLFCLLAFLGCNIINPSEEEASYIQIDSVNVITDVAIQGSNAANISDAWIYVDGQLIGAFELPCRIPVLQSGKHKVSIGAGVQLNGSSSLRTPYLFYRFHEQENVNLEPGQTTNISPTFSYFDSLTFAFKANFDDLSGNKLTSTSSSDTTLSLCNDPARVFEGAGSCLVELFRDSGFVDFQMIDPVSLPKGGANVFMEINYKNNTDLLVGLRSYYTGASTKEEQVITLRPTDSWNKVYINLTRQVSSQINAINYRIFFQTSKRSGSEPLEVLIDNFKIIY
jgi:hypothetical protein